VVVLDAAEDHAMTAPDRRLELAATLVAVARAFTYPVAGHGGSWRAAARSHTACTSLWQAWKQVDDSAVQALYSRLFLGTSACPLVETAWTGARRMAGPATELADIQGFYQAFGFTPGDVERTSADHITTELEFVAALCIKEAWADVNGWTDEVTVTRDAARHFLEVHPGRWASALAARIAEATDTGVYGVAASALRQAVAQACALFDARPDPIDEVLAPVADEDAVVCPMATTCAGGDVSPQPLPLIREGRP
jgi:TorA maturation chaperone TorD